MDSHTLHLYCSSGFSLSSCREKIETTTLTVAIGCIMLELSDYSTLTVIRRVEECAFLSFTQTLGKLDEQVTLYHQWL